MTDTDPDIERWKATDIVDPARYDDRFFEALAEDIEASLRADSASNVVSLSQGSRRRRRAVYVAAALAAALLVWLVVPEAPPPDVRTAAGNQTTHDGALDLADEDLVADALAEMPGADEAWVESRLAAALEASMGLSDEGEETLASAGSWITDLEDLTPAELSALATRL